MYIIIFIHNKPKIHKSTNMSSSGGASGGASASGHAPGSAATAASQRVMARDFKLSPELDRWTDVGEDLLLPGGDGGVVIGEGIVMFRVAGERTGKPDAVVCIGDSDAPAVPVSNIGPLDQIAPAGDGSGAVLALSNTTLSRLEVAVDLASTPSKASVSSSVPVLEQPADCEHFAFTSGVDSSGGVYAVAMVASGDDGDDTAPIIYPVPPSRLTLKYKTPAS